VLGELDLPLRQRLAVGAERGRARRAAAGLWFGVARSGLFGFWCHGFLQDLFDEHCFVGFRHTLDAEGRRDLCEIVAVLFFELGST